MKKLGKKNLRFWNGCTARAMPHIKGKREGGRFPQLACAPEAEEQRSDDPLKIVEIQPAQDPGNIG